MRKIIKFIIVILIIGQYNFVLSNYDNYRLCGRGGIESTDKHKIIRDKFIKNKLQNIYKNKNICNDIFLMGYDITSDFKNYILSIKKEDNIYIIQNGKIIHNLDDSQYQSLLVGVEISNNGEDTAYIFTMGERDDFLEKEGYKNLLGFYLNGTRVQDFGYKQGLTKFLKKYGLEYYFLPQQNQKFNYKLSKGIIDKIKNNTQLFTYKEKEIIIDYLSQKIRNYYQNENHTLSLREYKKQVIYNYIYSKIKIEHLINN